MHKNIFKIISIFLVLLLSFSLFSMHSFAVENELNNLFPRTDAYNSAYYMDTYADSTKTSDYIEVKENDVIYIAAALLSQKAEQLTLYNSEKAVVSTLYVSDLTLKEDLGRGYGILNYTIPANVSFATVTLPLGVYNDGDSFVTLNTAFSGAEYRAAVGIEEISEEVKEHPFYGKKALFLGDSQMYGSYDTIPSYRNPNTSWARNLILTTGIEATNVAVGGASARRSGFSHRSWIYDQLSPHLDEEYDIVVIKATENDAQDFAKYGDVLPFDTDPATLQENVSTVAGGMQWTMYSIKKAWPDAQIIFVNSIYRENYNNGRVKNAEGYYLRTQQLCEMYDGLFVNLYKNPNVDSKIDTTDRLLIPDKVHLSRTAYNLAFEEISAKLEEYLNNKNLALSITSVNATEEGIVFETNAQTSGNTGIKIDGIGLANKQFSILDENKILLSKEVIASLSAEAHSVSLLFSTGEIDYELNVVSSTQNTSTVMINETEHTYSSFDTIEYTPPVSEKTNNTYYIILIIGIVCCIILTAFVIFKAKKHS